MRFHLPNPVPVSLCSIAIAFGNLAIANPVDQAFRKAEATPNRITTKIHSSVYEDMGLSMRELQSKVDDGDRRAEERNSRSTATSSSAAPSGSSSSSSTSRNNPQAVRGSGGSGKVEYIKDFWLQKGEQKQIVIRCPNGVERGYSYFPKTGNYCTPVMTCNSSEAWIHRAVC
jgi:hypothetical protein